MNFQHGVSSSVDREDEQGTERVQDLLPAVLGATIGAGFGDLDKEEQQSATRWLHVPTRGSLELVILSAVPARAVTHWRNGRHSPCSEDGKCGLCLQSIGSQVRYGFSVLRLGDLQRGLLELGPVPCKTLAMDLRKFGYLRGRGFRLRKEGGKLRGAILVEPLGQPFPEHDLPEPEDVESAWLRQWQYDSQFTRTQGERLVDGV